MALNLNKSASAINLTKSVPNVSKYVIGLAWDQVGSKKQDFDASIVAMKAGRRSGLCYYGDLKAIGGVVHSGDARDGSAAGDDEVIKIDLSQVQEDELVATVTSYKSGTFGEGANVVARLYKDGDPSPLVEAKLASEAAFGTALALVRFYKDGSDWQFENVSKSLGSSENGLEDVVKTYA